MARGFFCMLSSICVATITGLPAALQSPTIFFCQMATVCSGTSTPRSPRATMMPSLSWRISSQLSRASWLSIFETISGIGCSGPNFSATTSAAYCGAPTRRRL